MLPLKHVTNMPFSCLECSTNFKVYRVHAHLNTNNDYLTSVLEEHHQNRGVGLPLVDGGVSQTRSVYRHIVRPACTKMSRPEGRSRVAIPAQDKGSIVIDIGKVYTK